jgi:outer membrane protein assembly factor BamA
VQVQEKNLLGRGQGLELEWQSDVSRESLTLTFYDPHFLQSHTRLAVAYSDASDGSTKYFSLERPFYALDTRWSAGTTLSDSEFNVDRYELGERVGKFETHAQYYQLNGGWSAGLRDGWVRRWTYGATYQESDFAPVPDAALGGPLPADRKFVYPWVGFELLEDSFQERVNQDQIRRTEDVLVGFNGWARLGLATESFGSATDAVLASAYASDGEDLSPTQSLFGSAWASGRYEHGEIRNGILGAEARYYLKTSARSKFFVDVSGTVTEQLDKDQQLTLGGDTGLRGYPFAYQAGTAKALLTLEQRYYTKWYPFRLFHVAGAAFVDTGRTWGTDLTGATSLGLLTDVGIGLRLGSSRSAFGNVLHIDLAFPLDGGDDIDSVQLVVETKAQF